MFLERLMNQTAAPVLERLLDFTAARHKLIVDNVANVDTPGYRQKDLSVEKFQDLLRQRVDARGSAGPGGVNFDDLSAEVEYPNRGILSHDGNNRSMEQLESDQAKNAMMHNLAVELLRKQYQQMEMALREKVV